MSLFFEIVKECKQLIEIFLTDGIEFMIVTLRAARCQPKPNAAHGA